MNEPVPPKRRKNSDFWRACRYLGPHRRIVIISVVCAFFVGAVFTCSLGTMLPVLKILTSGQTIPDWVNSHIAERRMHLKFSEDPKVVRIDTVDKGAPKELKNGQEIQLTDAQDRAQVLQVLSDPGHHQVTLSDGTTVDLRDVPEYLRHARNIAATLPVDGVKAIACVLAFIAGLTVLGNIVRFFQEYLSDKAAILAVNDIRRELYDHTLHISMGYYGQSGTSDVTSRLVQDAQGLQDGFKTVLGQSIQEPIKAAMALGLALFLSWKLVIFLLLFGPIAVVILRKFGKKMRRASRRALQNSSSMLGQIESSLIGIRVVKSALGERFERRRYRKIMDGLVDEQLRMSRIDAINAPTLETLNLLVVATVVLYASWLVLVAKSLDPSVFLLVMACLVGMGESMRRMSKVNGVLQKSNAAAARIFETMDMPVEVPRRREASTRQRLLTLAPISKDVLFDDVTFTYPNASSPALQKVSLRVNKGQCVAIVGRNGSGKTTLASLLPRFFTPQSGSVLIDGVDLRSVTLRSIRRQIGIVTQDSVIFPGTIAQNIAYALPQVSRPAIESAAKRAFAHDFIMEKQGGYDTLVGEHGASLSGGQKQRICIARAILRKTPILILDEATSQVDAESEHLIQKAIEELIHERTTFVIAHRFSTILSADQIVVMDRGQIVGQGPHAELLKDCEVYQQLYERQLFIGPAV